ncbi:unnamed protein product [Prunus armeniaca]|uniref:DUF4283 domain-containing protein n=1 Tax=Prunus armeniaca TaxID=36596 RepID=A0A6J5UCU6_PRUAR|nr:unnamed protein product [Prunus armeniaca]CAB4303978.1 unnamed protein product [Prunus armeniaca]
MGSRKPFVFTDAANVGTLEQGKSPPYEKLCSSYAETVGRSNCSNQGAMQLRDSLMSWSVDGLGYVPSVVGKPLYVDSLTKSKRRLSYARICVELDATDELIDTFNLRMVNPNGEVQVGEICVEY